jgi:hypothetical protein
MSNRRMKKVSIMIKMTKMRMRTLLQMITMMMMTKKIIETKYKIQMRFYLLIFKKKPNRWFVRIEAQMGINSSITLRIPTWMKQSCRSQVGRWAINVLNIPNGSWTQSFMRALEQLT